MAGEEDFCNFLARSGALEKMVGETHNCFHFLGSDRKYEENKKFKEMPDWFERGMEGTI